MARSKVKTNPRTRSTPRKIKEVMTHGETQEAAVAPSCCERVKVNQKLSRPQSPVKQTNTRDLPPNTGGEIRKSSEAAVGPVLVEVARENLPLARPELLHPLPGAILR